MWKASSVRSEILESMTPAERKRRRYDQIDLMGLGETGTNWLDFEIRSDFFHSVSKAIPWGFPVELWQAVFRASTCLLGFNLKS